ncbi:MAG: hypothetical protein KDB16_12565 [Acidimicrobiales bacterium]|nr:hypothetical protein [Acidimicrobiales bacterium]
MSKFAGKFAALLLGSGVVLSACSGGAAEPAASQPAESAPELEGTISTTGAVDEVDNSAGATEGEGLDIPVALPREDDSPASEPADSETPEAAEPADSLTDEGVLAAAVIILSDGDLEGAIADGVVSEAEAEAALAAIEQGTLDQYAG